MPNPLPLHIFYQAEPEEEGGHCNQYGEHVDNLSAFEAEIALRIARDLDEADVSVEYFARDPDERINRIIYQSDTSGPDDSLEPIRLGPGH